MSNAHCEPQAFRPTHDDWPLTTSIADRQAPADDAAHQFLGTWRLVGFSRNGQPHPAYGEAPTGTIHYDPDGRMSVQITPDASLIGESDGSIPNYVAYFGNYLIDPQAKTVAHERVGNVSAGEARTVVRHYEFLPCDRLALTPDEDDQAQVLWQRVHH